MLFVVVISVVLDSEVLHRWETEKPWRTFVHALDSFLPERFSELFPAEMIFGHER